MSHGILVPEILKIFYRKSLWEQRISFLKETTHQDFKDNFTLETFQKSFILSKQVQKWV